MKNDFKPKEKRKTVRMKIGYEVTKTGDIFADQETAEMYAKNLRKRGHETEVKEVVV